jgi:gliding-associated putative ABC transporter substrate-binding component GldG
MAEKKRILSGIFNFTFLGVVVAAVILVNVISAFVYTRIDMTSDRRYSLADGTVEYLKKSENFKGRLNMKIYLAGNLPAELSYFRNAVEDKLKEFKQYAGDRIEFQFIDPNEGTDQEQKELHDQLWAQGRGILPMNVVYSKDGEQSQLLLWPGAVLEYGGATVNTVQLLPGSKMGAPFQLKGMNDMIQNSINNLEYLLISSIRRATQESKKRVAFLQGHGELNFQETQRIRALLTPYYNVVDIELKDSIHALDKVDGLIVARPRSKFSEKDLYLIDQFLLKGGRLMCFMDQLYLPEDTLMRYGQTSTFRYETGLDRMLFDYGLKIQDNYIIDAQCVPKQVPLADKPVIPWFFHVLATPTSHPISRNVEPVALKYSNEIQFVGNNPDIALTPVLTSSTNATGTGLAPMVSLAMPLNYGQNPELVPNPDSESNKKCLAGLAEGMFTSYFKNRIVEEFINNPEIDYKEKSVKEGKVFLIGNGRFIANEYDSMPDKLGNGFMYKPKQLNTLQFSDELIKLQIPHFFGNQEFFQNLTDYMMGDNSVLDIRSRQIDIHHIDQEKVKSHATYFKVVNLLVPIGSIIILAFAMNYMRKRKYAR